MGKSTSVFYLENFQSFKIFENFEKKETKMKIFFCVLTFVASQGMFDAKRHRKEGQKEALKEKKFGQKFGATSLVDSAFKGKKSKARFLSFRSSKSGSDSGIRHSYRRSPVYFSQFLAGSASQKFELLQFLHGTELHVRDQTELARRRSSPVRDRQRRRKQNSRQNQSERRQIERRLETGKSAERRIFEHVFV